jgi:hypothetical protein
MKKHISITVPLYLSSVPHAQLRLTVTQEHDQSSKWYGQKVSYVLMLHNESGAHVIRHGENGLDGQGEVSESNIKLLIQGLQNDLNMRYRGENWNLTT